MNWCSYKESDMKQMTLNRRDALAASFAAAAAAMLPRVRAEAAERAADPTESTAIPMSETRTFTKTTPPAWLLACEPACVRG
jgi:hypothetical protein